MSAESGKDWRERNPGRQAIVSALWLRLYRTDLADELVWIRRGGPAPLAHNHVIEGGWEMYVRNAPCPRCEQIKAAILSARSLIPAAPGDNPPAPELPLEEKK